MARTRSKLPLFDNSAKIEKAARTFHADNPHVYAKLRALAFQVKRAGVAQFGIGAIFEQLRWLAAVKSGGDRYKLNNNYRGFYARLLMEQEPGLAGFFHVRGQAFDTEYRHRQPHPQVGAADAPVQAAL